MGGGLLKIDDYISQKQRITLRRMQDSKFKLAPRVKYSMVEVIFKKTIAYTQNEQYQVNVIHKILSSECILLGAKERVCSCVCVWGGARS